MMRMLLEAPVFTIEAAIKAAEFGVDRIELCADFGEGGTTPSIGTLIYLKKKISIPIFVMIRPRGGDFVYSDEELEIMKIDLQMLKTLGADGFVFGVLKADGKVNIGACEDLIQLTDGLPCTFHRAIDATPSLEKSLEAIIECGFRRVLTSGGSNTVEAGKEMVKKLMVRAADRIVILPGGGTSPEHVPYFESTGYLKELHASCKMFRPSKNRFYPKDLKLSTDPNSYKQILTIDPDKVAAFRAVMDQKNERI
ncbi:copper homeostasis protein CutC [Pararhodonellum marinum]|uniref:copper homeostasis protein CutC n=1 Tax=Pararhodonellum marinum TaxID=2755358 RepID=UPI00188F9142|nr:copper homeostasis protein CutC [Pararhodonellum marinum]